MSAGEQDLKISVSYRRTDSAMAGRIFDRLVQRFGKKSLFIDIDNIPFGGDFRKHVDDALKSSDLLIAMVGPKWLGGEGKDSKIARDADPVRVEIETALKQKLPVLPVLLDDARMPEPSELPESIRDFAYLNAAEVESGRDFDVHVDRVIKAIEQILGPKVGAPIATASEKSALVSPAPPAPPTAKRSLMPLILGGGLLALAGIAAAVWFARDRVSVADEIDPTTGTAYCSDFKDVIEESRTDFNALLGRRDGDGIWISRTQLPGWDNCRIADWTTQGKIIRYFGCELPSVATVDDLHAKRDRAVTYLQSCLGKSWARKRDTFGNGATETNFKLGSEEPIARIRESIYTDGRGNILRIEVDVPAPLIREAPEAVSDRPPAPEPPATAAYCDALKRVVAEAHTNFVSILGPTSTQSWPSRIQLPGWAECRIMDFTSENGPTRRYQYCNDPSRFATIEDLHARRDTVVPEVRSCLGSDWTDRLQEFSDKTTDTVFYMGVNDPLVRIRETFVEAKKDYELTLEIEAPTSAGNQPQNTPPPQEAAPNQPATPPPEAAPNEPATPPPAAD